MRSARGARRARTYPSVAPLVSRTPSVGSRRAGSVRWSRAGQDLRDYVATQDAAQVDHLVAAAITREQVVAERASHEVGPCSAATSGLRFGGLACCRELSITLVCDDARASARPGREHAVVQDEVLVWARDERGEFGQEIERLEREMGRSV